MKKIKLAITASSLLICTISSYSHSWQGAGWTCVAGDKGICVSSGEGYKCMRIGPEYPGNCDAVYNEEEVN